MFSRILVTTSCATIVLATAGCGRTYRQENHAPGLQIQSFKRLDGGDAIATDPPRPYRVNSYITATELQNPAYREGMEAVAKATKATTAHDSAVLLIQAKTSFMTAAAALANDPGDAAICHLNAAACAANLGDNQEAQRLLALVPNESPWRWYHNASLIRTQTQGNVTQVDGGGVVAWVLLMPIRLIPALCTGFQWTWPHVEPTDEDKAIFQARQDIKFTNLDQQHTFFDHRIPKTILVTPAIEAKDLVFNWAQDTPAQRTLRDITVTVSPQTFGYTRLGYIVLQVENHSERVITIKDMAARFEFFQDDAQKYQAETWDLKTVDAEYRLLPQRTTSVQLLTQIREESLGSARTGRLTVFDIPAEFDQKTGVLTQKLNLAWDFQFKPGQNATKAVTREERDTSKSFVTYNIISKP